MSDRDSAVGREEVVRFERWRPTHLAEMALSGALIIAASVPVMLVTEDALLAGASGAIVVAAINEVLWRYRGYPELAPSGRLIEWGRSR